MKLRPWTAKKEPSFPSFSEHKAHRRQFLSTIGKAGVAVGLCGMAAQSFAGNVAPAEKEEDEKRVAEELKDLKNKIASLSKDLSHKEFKVRKHATEKLITLGKPELKDGKDKNETARCLVLEKMIELKKHRDPEVKSRAKEITLAITPPKPVKDQGHRPALGGVMVAPDPF